MWWRVLGIAVVVAIVASGLGGLLSLPFLVVAVIMLAALRPIARSHRKMPAQIRTGTAALVGRTALVLERVANDEGTGSVRLEGEKWTARAYDEDEVFEPGARVHVVEIKGATALVTEV